jgi:Fe-S cluster assembly protein SufD
MSEQSDATRQFVEQFAESESRLGGEFAPWLRQVQKAAMARFTQSGLPSSRDEQWKYTSIRPIEKRRFVPANGTACVAAEQIAGLLPGTDDPHLVFVNGQFAPDLSNMRAGDGIRLASLADALARSAETLEPHLAHYADYNFNGFTALNTAFIGNGAVIQIADDVHCARPIHILHLSVPGEEPVSCHPRTLLVTGRHSRVTLVEQFAGLQDAANLTNAVTEIMAGPGAVVNHVRVQRESPQGYLVGSVHIRQLEGSRVESHNLDLGGRLVRNDLNVVLTAPGAEIAMSGLYLTDGRQHVDNHTRVDHAAPSTRSDELYRGIVAGHSRAVFNGKVLVRKDAQKIAAQQANHNLLLSDKAEVDTKPELEIYADDVQCSHGATVGQLDEDALFYLRSRGVDAPQARQMLTRAFGFEVLARQPDGELRDWLESLAAERLAALAQQGGAR